MPAPWISLALGAAVVLLLVYAFRRYRRAATEAAYVDELERLAQARADDFALLTRLSAALGSVLDLDTLKRIIASELPSLTGTDDFFVVARLNGWMLLAGQPAEPGSPVPAGLASKPDAWECFPLTTGGKTVGLMGIRQPAGGFGEDRRRVLATMATLIAAAVKNTQLFNRVRDLSMIDPLTRTLTRQFGVEALSREMRRMRRAQSALCVAILDLDHFKNLNDTHGHLAGDRALAMVGRVLKEGLRASDIACRYGGEEFLIVLPETSLSGGVRAVENLRRRIGATPIDAGTGPIKVTASVGITNVALAEEDPTVPITRADVAMYEAKRAGRNRVAVKETAQSEGPLIPPAEPL
ncbi:MAG: GGDEF domain-containing protein [Acidobacteria bacterium]|nr:GGDEF domain-containing protein [Acidobacteriota bacterium]